MAPQQSMFKSETARQRMLAIYDQVLSRWPAGHETRMITTRFGATHVIVCGNRSNPPLVLLHGSGSNSTICWTGYVSNYCTRRCVYAVDIPGEPGRSEERRFPWNDGSFTLWLDDLFNGLHIEKAMVSGMSLGAWASVRYAIDRPDRVEKIALISPGGITHGRLSFVLHLIVNKLLGTYGHKRMMRLLLNSDGTISGEFDETMKLISTNFRYRMGEPPLFTDKELRSITMPLLFVAGDKDCFFHTNRSAQRLQRLVPHAMIHIIKNGGHPPLNTAPVIVPFM